MSDHVFQVGDSDFSQLVLQSEQPVLVDFTAAWCAPCRALAPVLDAFATDHADKLKVAKLDVDENQATAERYGIRSMPTLLLFKGGKVVQQIVGAVPRAKLEEAISRAL